jgi:hypothetical protein
MLDLVGNDWKDYLKKPITQTDTRFQQHEKTGRPSGTERSVERAGKLLNRTLKKNKPGSKPVDS